LEAFPTTCRAPILSSTPRRPGLAGGEGLAVDWSAANGAAVVTDLVYVPLQTPFLQGAAGRGLSTVDGLGMLLHQAAPASSAGSASARGWTRNCAPRFSPTWRDRPVLVIGLTGSIGMGKSTTAAMFRARGCPVHDADAAVHRLYRGEAVPQVEAAFPGVTSAGAIDRRRSGSQGGRRSRGACRLEGIIHPLVRAEEEAFLSQARALGSRLVVLDVPLLFEAGSVARVEAVVVVSAPPDVQRARVMSRPAMTEEVFEKLLSRQLPDREKRCRAHFIVDTGRGMRSAEGQVDAVLRALAAAS
jgi:dephospho-CoA kinase